MDLPQNFSAAVLRHRARLAPGQDGAFILSDTPAPKPAWQVFEIPHRDVARATVRLRLAMRPIEGGSALLSLHQALGVEIATIGRDGALVSAKAEALTGHSVETDAEGWLRIELLYVNKGPSIVLGLGNPRSRYVGSNTPQLELKDLRIEVVEARWTPSPADPLRIVEMGLGTAADAAWLPFAAGLDIATFPPPAGHALAGKLLSDRNGTSPFHVARSPAQSSLLKPDPQRLPGYPSAAEREITAETRIETCRFDSLVKQGLAAAPDVIRLEATGAEYNALRGFGNLLDRVMAVETPVYLYPVYRKQKLMSDIVDLLESSGLAVARLVPSPQNAAQFGREMVKMNAIFLRRQPPAEALGRYQLLEEIWALPSSF